MEKLSGSFKYLVDDKLLCTLFWLIVGILPNMNVMQTFRVELASLSLLVNIDSNNSRYNTRETSKLNKLSYKFFFKFL